MISYWPAWAAALALGAITVGYWIALRRPLGVSGVLARFSRIREEAAVDRGFDALSADQAALEAAMIAMTTEAFGMAPEEVSSSMEGPDAPEPVAPSPDPASAMGSAPAAPVTQTFEAPAGRACAPTPALGEHAVFLIALVAGGLIASLLRGTFGAGMGEPFGRLVAAGPAGLAALTGGGLLVGFGTALCGGCTAGHGLTGCGRLMPGSLASTALFFGAAVGVSFLIGGLT